jgi:hypothetical protein
MCPRRAYVSLDIKLLKKYEISIIDNADVITSRYINPSFVIMGILPGEII